MENETAPTEITDEEIDQLIAQVSEECEIDDDNDFDIVAELDNFVISESSSKTLTDKKCPVVGEGTALNVKEDRDKNDVEKARDPNDGRKEVEQTGEKDKNSEKFDVSSSSSKKKKESKSTDKESSSINSATKCAGKQIENRDKSLPTMSENISLGNEQNVTKLVSPELGRDVACEKVAGSKGKSGSDRQSHVAKEVENKESKGLSSKAAAKVQLEKEAATKIETKPLAGVTEKNITSKKIEKGETEGVCKVTRKTSPQKGVVENKDDKQSGTKEPKQIVEGKRQTVSASSGADTDKVDKRSYEIEASVQLEAGTSIASTVDNVASDAGAVGTTASGIVSLSAEKTISELTEEDRHEASLKTQRDELKDRIVASLRGTGAELETLSQPLSSSDVVPEDANVSQKAGKAQEQVQLKKEKEDREKNSSDDSLKAEQPTTKKGWNWGGIGSWGSNVLNQVGDSLYQVFETVESSLVEPENTNINLKQKMNSKEIEPETEVPVMVKTDKNQPESKSVAGIIQVQPSNAESAIAESSSISKQVNDTGLVEEASAVTGSEEELPGTRKEKGPIDRNKEDASDDTTMKLKNKKKLKPAKVQGNDQSSHEQSWFSAWGLSTITGAVQQTGRKVVSTGLDVFENLSKKAMSVVTEEAEDGVAPLSPSSSTPSPSISPKKKKSGTKGNEKEEKLMLTKCFDDCQGLAHFDALTALSQASQEKLNIQLEKLDGERLVAVKSDLMLIRDASDLGGMDWETNFGNTEHDFHQLIKDFVTQLNLNTNMQKLFSVQETTSKWLTACIRDNANDKKYSAEDIHKMAILMLADVTAAGIAQYHKIAQLLLVDYSSILLSYKFRALSLAGLTKVLCTEIWIQTRRFTECLNQPNLMESSDLVMHLITNLTLEASNCSSCLQDGYHLLLPVIQLASLKVHPLTTESTDVPNLEGLQLTSCMSQSKVSRILNNLSVEMREVMKTNLATVEAAFELSYTSSEPEDEKSDHNFGQQISESLGRIGVDISAQKLLQAQERTRQWLLSCERDQENSLVISANDIHQRALQSLNDLTTCAVELFHKIAQVILLENPREISTYSQRAAGITSLVRSICVEVGVQSTKFTNRLTASASRDRKADEASATVNPAATISDSITQFITNIYLEASNSSTCIQDGFQLLLPIIQLALLKAHSSCSDLDD